MKKLLFLLTLSLILLALAACPAAAPSTGTTGTTAATGTTASSGGTVAPNQPGGTTGTTGTTGGTDSPSQPSDPTPPSGEAVYTVFVQDAEGKPAENVVVRLTGGDVNKIALCEGGWAAFKLPVGQYAVTVEAPEGSFYHEPLTLTAQEQAGTVTLYTKLTEYTYVSAYGLDGDMDDRVRAYTLVEGTSYYALKSATRSYFLFTPTRGGVYRISVRAAVFCEIGNFGDPIAALQTSAAEQTEEGILIDLPDSGVGAAFLIGISHAAAEKTDAFITLERISEHAVSPEELPWEDVLPQKTPASITLAGEGETAVLTDLDITDKNLTVVLGTDGFYHLGTAEGAVVYLRIGTASAYLDSLLDICAVTRFGAYLYKEDGTFDRKESYNLLIEAYAAAADKATGLYPLTEELAYVMQVMGEYYGWWKTGETSIFGTTPVVPAVAWLFACVTVEIAEDAEN